MIATSMVDKTVFVANDDRHNGRHISATVRAVFPINGELMFLVELQTFDKGAMWVKKASMCTATEKDYFHAQGTLK